MSILCLQQKNRIIRAVVCTVIFLLYTTSTITTTIANKEKKVLVTGGMGNIGKYLVKELLGMGYSVICMDIQNLTSPDLVELYRGSNVSFYSRFYEFVRMDIRDLDGWYNLLRMEKPSINGIIHLAAVSRVSFCLDNELDCRDINERGTQVITDAVAKYVASGGKKPWLIFASSREIYGESCLPGSPCNEVSPPQPLNLYGETKLIGERILEGTNKIFEGRIVIRLASVYGGLYDQPERLIPSLSVNSMADTVIDAIDFSSKDFDFVHIADVLASIQNAMQILETSPDFIDDFLICSGRSTSASDLLTMIQKFTRSQSPVRKMLSDSRYPSKFHCDNKKMITGLKHSPIYSDMELGITTYLRELYSTNLNALSGEYQRQCGQKRALNVIALDGCKVFITVLQGPRYLSSIANVELKRYGDSKTKFTLTTAEGEEPVFVGDDGSAVFMAYTDEELGGYKLFVNLKDEFMVVNEILHIVSVQTDTAVSVSIWPTSCPPNKSGKARLPAEHFDKSLYLLHEIIPSTEEGVHQPGSAQDTHCKRLSAAMNYSMGILNQDASQGLRDSPIEHRRESFGMYHHAMLPLCDTSCALIGGCIKTGNCRCVTPMCGSGLQKPIPFPFSKYAFRNQVTFPAVAAKTSNASFETVLTGAAALFHSKIHTPKVFVYDITSFMDRFVQFENSPKNLSSQGCAEPEYIMQEAFLLLNVSLARADLIFIPFYQTLLWKLSNVSTERLLREVSSEVLHKLQHMKKRPLLIYPMTHLYGGYQDAVADYRTLSGKSMMQSSVLHDSIVLSPMGDYNTLAYLPHKDIVIPPYVCGDVTFLDMFGSPHSVKPSRERLHTVFFAGEVENYVGKAARFAVMSGALFPRLHNKVQLKGVSGGLEYARFLNDSVFCLHIFGAAGWSARLSETIFAGCIPVLTSDVTHPPFSDVLNWAKFSYFVDWRDLEQLEEVLLSIAPQEIEEKQESLLLVRDAFMYDPSPAAHKEEISGARKGPVFLTLLTLKMRTHTFFPTWIVENNTLSHTHHSSG